MIPFGSAIVTLYYRTESVDMGGRTRTDWQKATISDCSWRIKNISRLIGNATVITRECTCRIPPSAQKPGVGDVIILGIVNDLATNAIMVSKLMDKYSEAFRIASVADLTGQGMPLQHYVARGDIA